MALASDREKTRRELQQRVDFIENTISIDDLLSRIGVQMDRRGKILCIFPDHNERTPSMAVYRDNNRVHCFGCNRSMGMIEIVRRCVPESGVWTKLKAVAWIGREFEIRREQGNGDIRNRVSRRLRAREARKSKSTVTTSDVSKSFLRVRDELRKDFPREATASLDSVEDYIWSQLDDPRIPLQDWLPWALSILRDYYRHKTLQSLQERDRSIQQQESMPLVLLSLAASIEPVV